MHRDVVTHVAVSAADFFITGSVDGTVCSNSCLDDLFAANAVLLVWSSDVLFVLCLSL